MFTLLPTLSLEYLFAMWMYFSKNIKYACLTYSLHTIRSFEMFILQHLAFIKMHFVEENSFIAISFNCQLIGFLAPFLISPRCFVRKCHSTWITAEATASSDVWPLPIDGCCCPCSINASSVFSKSGNPGKSWKETNPAILSVAYCQSLGVLACTETMTKIILL